MNLWDKRIGLLIIAALTFFACAEDKLGIINIAPENSLEIFFVEQSLIDQTNQVWVGSGESRSTGNVLAGSYTDSHFGNIYAEGYLDIGLTQLVDSSSFVKDATLDSIVVELRIINFYGTAVDDINQQNFTIRYLDGDLISESEYTTASQLAASADVGTSIIVLSKDSVLATLPTDPTELEKIDSADRITKYDANRRYIYLERFQLNTMVKEQLFNAYKNAIIDGQGSNGKDSLNYINTLFDEYFTGLALIPNANNDAIITFDASDIYSLVKIYYSHPSDEAGKNNMASLPFSPPTFNYISPNENTGYTNAEFSDINTILTSINSASDYAYVQSGSNLLLSIDFSGIDSLRSNVQRIMIQQAVILIDDVEIDTVNLPNLMPPSQLSVQMTSLSSINDGIFSERINDNILIDLPQDITYQADSNNYVVGISLFMQSVIDGDNTNDQLIFRGLATQRDINVSRARVKKENIKLRYYYTITN